MPKWLKIILIILAFIFLVLIIVPITIGILSTARPGEAIERANQMKEMKTQ